LDSSIIPFSLIIIKDNIGIEILEIIYLLSLSILTATQATFDEFGLVRKEIYKGKGKEKK